MTPPASERPDRAGLDGFGFDLAEEEWLACVRDSMRCGPLGAIGPYKILDEIARGGQGVVFRAEQPGTGRVIALKRMIAGRFASERGRQRFEREMEITARLHHPGIVTLLGVENVDGQPVLAMEWIDGVTPVRWARAEGAEPRAVRETLRLMVRIADAVHHAHQKGVIHRDLKPSNILVDAEDRPHVLDFGVAKLELEEGSATGALTRTDEFMGSPTYAPPEQLLKGALAADVRGDVYALGMVLYEMLAGRAPYDFGTSFADVLHTLETRQPRPPSVHRPELSLELDTVVSSAIAKDLDLRYPSVDALRADLSNLLEERPITAHPPSAWYTLRKLVGRNRLASSLGAALLASLAILGVASQLQGVALRERTAQAERSRGEAEASETRVRQVLRFVTRDLFSGMDPAVRGYRPQLDEVLSDAGGSIGERFADDPQTEAELRAVVGDLQTGLGNFTAAGENLRRAEALLAAMEDPDPERAVAVRVKLARALAHQNLYAEAEGVLESLRGAGFYEDERDAQWIRLLITRGRLEEALAGCTERIARQAAVLEPDARELWNSRLERAGVLRRMGRGDESVAELSALLAEARERFGEDHLDTARAHRELGLALTIQGDFPRGEEEVRRGLETRRALLGERHPDVAQSLADLAGILVHGERRTEEAEALLEEAIAIFRGAGAAHHETVAEAWSTLAGIQSIRGDYVEADRLLGEALAILEERFGADHPALAGVLADRGSCLSYLARASGEDADFGRADELFRQAHAITVRTLGPHHRNAAHALNGRAGNARLRGDERLAARCYEEAIEVLQSNHPGGHPIIVLVLNNLGGLHRSLGELESALAVFARSREMAEACGLPAGHVDTVSALRGLARTHGAAGAHKRAAELQRSLVEGAEAWNLPAVEAAFDKARLGLCLRSLGDAAGGLALLREALVVLERERPDDPLTEESARILVEARGDGE
ncbi:MAG TPA: serine/threonine-protein kinase [Planctomycetota bacterium]|nr:serine/threonine-protein kinase [Planctomycetota bacterium]